MSKRHSFTGFLALQTITAMVILLVWPVLSLNAQSSVNAFRPSGWLGNASLNDVVFVDPDVGFVVGDHGLILRTTDGGRTWSRSRSGVSCNLESVFFADEKTGWAVGGISMAQLNETTQPVAPSAGVVLKTADGGIHWKRIQTKLPALRDVQFVSAEQGYAVGESSHFHPSGIFVTHNGGESWSGSSADQFQSWKRLAAASDRMVALNPDSQIARIDGNRMATESVLVPSQLTLNDLSISTGGRQSLGIAVGDRASVLIMQGPKSVWKFQANPIHPEFDLKTVSTVGNRAWAAGFPGTYVHAFDSNKGSWTSYNTGQSETLHRLFFLDSERGWAVGAQGTILRTRDGGATWQHQRGQKSRVALTIVVDDPAQIPFELLGKYSAEAGLITSVVLVDSSSTVQNTRRARHACSRLGNTHFEHLRVQKPAGASGSLTNEAVRQLTKIIRSQKPMVVVSSQKPGIQRTEFDMDQAVVSAARAASDKYKFQKQLTQAGLTTWEVRRVLVDAGSASGFHLVEHDAQMMIQSGALLSDQIALSRGMVGQPLNQPKLHLMDMFSAGNQQSNDLFGPLKSQLVRRPRSNATTARMDQIKKSTHKKKWMEEMDSWRLGDQQSPRGWHHQINQFVQSLDEQTAGLWLYQLAEQYAEEGHHESAIATHETLLRKFPEHWLTDRSMLWLLHHFNSAEMTVAQFNAKDQGPRRLSDPFPAVQKADYQAKPKLIREGGQTRVVWEPVQPDAVKKTSHSEPEAPTAPETGFAARLKRAKRIADYARQRNSFASSDPETDFAIAVLNRKIAPGTSTTTRFGQIAGSQTASPSLKFVARREVELQKKTPSLQASTIMICPAINVKPFLDGKLDEAIWRSSEERAIRIQGDSHIASTRILTARDQEYFYLAIVANKIVEGISGSAEAKRTRDPDLSTKDRVTLRLDLDRDFQSWFEFTIDYQGNVSERLGQNRNWNPNWYVARAEDRQTWTIEAAIPISELMGPQKDQLPMFGQNWGISILRQNRTRSLSWPHRTDGRPYGTLKIQ